jgi:hypothetical protein
LNIFKQDSTFQNTKTEIDISYFISYNTRIYIGYQSRCPATSKIKNNAVISDYNNSFITANLDYSKQDSANSLFSHNQTPSTGLETDKLTIRKKPPKPPSFF